jgi:hypothetical protein
MTRLRVAGFVGSGRHRMSWSLAAIYPSPSPFPKEGEPIAGCVWLEG